MTNSESNQPEVIGQRAIRSRLHRDMKNPPPLRLTKRDFKILNVVGQYQLLSARHIQRLFFRSLHKTRKRLFKLWQHGLLDRRFAPIALGEGASPTLYTLACKGDRLLVSQEGATGEAGQGATRIAPFRSKASSLFYEHTLRRNEFRLALSLACEQSANVRLLFWRQDRSIKESVEFVNGPGSAPILRKIPLLADGFFALQIKEKAYYFFLEVDCGTTDSKRMLLKLKGYYHLWFQHRHVRRYGIDNFRVLLVTTSQARQENLVQLARKVREGKIGSGLFWLTTFNRYSFDYPLSIFGNIWKRGHISNGHEYSLLN